MRDHLETFETNRKRKISYLKLNKQGQLVFRTTNNLFLIYPTQEL